MYKNLLIAVIIAFFAGCSAPKPQQEPSWYISPPQDFKNFYSVALASDEGKAKNRAINSLRDSINRELNTLFQTPNKLSPNNIKLQEIIKSNNKLCNQLVIRNVKVEKTELFNGEVYILISIPRIQLFEKFQLMSKSKLQELKQQYNKNREFQKMKRYLYIKPLMNKYSYLASLSGAKKIALPSFSSDSDFRFLKELSDEYENFLSTINFYILSDGNSRKYSNIIKDAIADELFSASSSSKQKNSGTLTLLISSDTTNSQEYTFMVSKHLVKFTTFDANKNKIAFRQHTFIGKSRRGHEDAALQATLSLRSKVKKLGIFNFIGLQND